MARTTGHKATIYCNGRKMLEMQDATLTISPKFAESLGWEKNWTVTDPVGGATFKVSGTKYVSSGNVGQMMALAALTPQATTPMTIIVSTMVGTVLTPILQGPVWAGESSYTLPEAEHSKEMLEFIGADTPTYLFGVTPTA